MSNKAINYIFENSKTVGSARVLMLAIADMANDDGECWPGKAKLHSKVNVSVRMITRLIQECERLGELAVIQGEQNQTNRYLVIGVAAEKRVEKARPAREKKPRAKRVTSDTSVTSAPQDITPDDTGVITPDDTGVTQTLSKPSTKTLSMPAAKAAAKRKKSKANPRSAELEPDIIYETVETHIFGIEGTPDMPYQWSGRCGQITSWLKGAVASVDGQEVGKISRPAAPEHIKAFARAWVKEHTGAPLPRKPDRFVEHWRAWASKQAGARPRANLQEATPEDKAALVREYVA